MLLIAKDLNPGELDFLLRFPAVPNVTSPVDFMNNYSWGGIKVCFPLPAHHKDGVSNDNHLIFFKVLYILTSILEINRLKSNNKEKRI